MEKRITRFRPDREAIGVLFGIIAIVFLVMPFWSSFQDLLTRGIMQIGWYKQLQETIVPYELRMIEFIMVTLGMKVHATSTAIQGIDRAGSRQVIYLIWNCVGWQSFVMFLVTLVAGLSRRYTVSSRIEAFLIGLLGTYLVNLVRLVLVVWVYFFTGRLFGTVFHDYFSGFLTFLWLFIYWGFVYRYVLVRRKVKEVPAVINKSEYRISKSETNSNDKKS